MSPGAAGWPNVLFSPPPGWRTVRCMRWASPLRTLVALLAVGAVVPPGATAAKPEREAVSGPAGSDRGLRLGERAFGLPACGRPVVAYASFVGPHLLSGADLERCRVLINADLADRMPRAMVCTLVLHEWGHLTGRGHSPDRASVMYRDYLEPDERCVSTRPAARRTSGKPRRRA